MAYKANWTEIKSGHGVCPKPGEIIGVLCAEDSEKRAFWYSALSGSDESAGGIQNRVAEMRDSARNFCTSQNLCPHYLGFLCRVAEGAGIYLSLRGVRGVILEKCGKEKHLHSKNLKEMVAEFTRRGII